MCMSTSAAAWGISCTWGGMRAWQWATILLMAGCFAVSGCIRSAASDEEAGKASEKKDESDPMKADGEKKERVEAPELEGGIGWLNTAGPIRLKDLRGKIVVLDFWTFCCINCIHTLPDLAKLEKKYANELVIIGVHSPKFENEKNTESVRKAILRYQITHPVVNDADQKIWGSYF